MAKSTVTNIALALVIFYLWYISLPSEAREEWGSLRQIMNSPTSSEAQVDVWRVSIYAFLGLLVVAPRFTRGMSAVYVPLIWVLTLPLVVYETFLSVEWKVISHFLVTVSPARSAFCIQTILAVTIGALIWLLTSVQRTQAIFLMVKTLFVLSAVVSVPSLLEQYADANVAWITNASPERDLLMFSAGLVMLLGTLTVQLFREKWHEGATVFIVEHAPDGKALSLALIAFACMSWIWKLTYSPKLVYDASPICYYYRAYFDDLIQQLSQLAA